MTVRASMSDLITRTRLMIGDPTGSSSVFMDQEVQDVLDERRTDIVEAQLSFRPTTVTGGPVVQYRDYWAPFGSWEDSVSLMDATISIVTPDTADLIRGHWAFSAGHLPPIFISGSFYDLYGSAASLLERWAAKVTQEFDFTVDNQQFRRSQKQRGLEQLALAYRRFSIPPGRRPLWRGAEWRSPLW